LKFEFPAREATTAPVEFTNAQRWLVPAAPVAVTEITAVVPVPTQKLLLAGAERVPPLAVQETVGQAAQLEKHKGPLVVAWEGITSVRLNPPNPSLLPQKEGTFSTLEKLGPLMYFQSTALIASADVLKPRILFQCQQPQEVFLGDRRKCQCGRFKRTIIVV